MTMKKFVPLFFILIVTFAGAAYAFMKMQDLNKQLAIQVNEISDLKQQLSDLSKKAERHESNEKSFAVQAQQCQSQLLKLKSKGLI